MQPFFPAAWVAYFASGHDLHAVLSGRRRSGYCRTVCRTEAAQARLVQAVGAHLSDWKQYRRRSDADSGVDGDFAERRGEDAQPRRDVHGKPLCQPRCAAVANSVQVPIWDTPGVDVTSTFTTTMTEDEVYPPIQEEPIRVAAHSIFVRGAFDYSTFIRGGGKQEVRYTKFIPK